ncbi:hypothetical protein E1181_15455 [Saccharopolyspora terrae]|uniref:Transcription regulator HTH AraC- type ligand binding domain-containing protein n=1 Tax=Saccharopolyspora terrae TaxID=2530384 RepID=A0A4R4VSJ3_9PSEU|nr:hypothetical protein [Saccharopolyspora terrae]TDD05315.1 hypothetical protein E1181_15455 [Saccharopolyspora terrae]
MTVTLRTDEVPDPRDRHDFLRQIVRETVVPLRLHQERPQENHWGEVVRTDLPCGSVARLSAFPTKVDRTPRMIRESDPDLYQVQMHLAGTSLISEGAEEVQIGPGEVVVFDPHRPFHASVGYPVPASQQGEGITRVVNLMLPRQMLDLRGPRDTVTKARLSCQNPMNPLAATAMVELNTQHLAGNIDLVTHLTSVIAELLTFGLAHQLESLSSVAPETRENVLFWSVRRSSSPGWPTSSSRPCSSMSTSRIPLSPLGPSPRRTTSHRARCNACSSARTCPSSTTSGVDASNAAGGTCSTPLSAPDPSQPSLSIGVFATNRTSTGGSASGTASRLALTASKPGEQSRTTKPPARTANDGSPAIPHSECGTVARCRHSASHLGGRRLGRGHIATQPSRNRGRWGRRAG